MRWGKQSERDHEKWLRDIRAFGLNLTTWEENFVERVTRKIEAGQSLTEREAEKLEQIYAERTP